MFVAAELRKQIGWSETRPALYHYRTHQGREVDRVLESPSGRLVGIEVKASATVSASDFRGLDDLADVAGELFQRGIVLYLGAELVPFGAKKHAMPVSALWRLGRGVGLTAVRGRW